MAGKSSAENRAKKAKMIEKIYELMGSHKQIILVNFANVGSNQVQSIRKQLRGYHGTLVIAKNTLLKKIIKMRSEKLEAEWKHLSKYGGLIPELQTLIPQLEQKTGLIFTEASIFEIKSKIEANKLPTVARVGSLAPIDYTVQAGPTNMDPSQINFFHALNISTKIVQGQIEITRDFKVTTAGKKVKASEAALLKKLNIKPFSYGMKVKSVYTAGAILPEEVLSIDPTTILGRFQNGLKNILGLSLASGYTVEPVVPFIISSAFRNLGALSLESGYKVKELEVSAAAPKAEKAEKKDDKPAAKPAKDDKPAPKVEAPPPAEEEEGMDMGGLFD